MKVGFECRSCGAREGSLVLDLGIQPLANNLLRPEDVGKPEPKGSEIHAAASLEMVWGVI